MDINNKKIAVIGLGYVGLPLAVEFGKVRKVLGFDINKKRINELLNFKDSTLEVSKDELHRACHLDFSADKNQLQECQIYIITVPTPIDEANHPDLTILSKASEMVSQFLKKGDLVIYESTVFPGCTEEVCVPILEKFSKLKFNEDFFCGYSPERINPGDKVNTLTKIKKVTSGSTPEVAAFVDELYKSIIKAGTHMASSIKVAEAAKVIENSQRDLNIAFVNELSVIFNRLQIDTIEVLEAAGTKWNFLPFRPGIVGGHCIGVDPYYLTYKAEKIGYYPQVLLAGRRINENMSRYVAINLIRLMIHNKINISQSTVGVMGITFKENCPDIRNSKVIDIIDELKKWGVRVIVSDPWADCDEVKTEYGIHLETISKTNQVDSLIIGVAHDKYKNLTLDEIKGFCRSKNPVLADIKSIYDKQIAIQTGFSVFRL